MTANIIGKDKRFFTIATIDEVQKIPEKKMDRLDFWLLVHPDFPGNKTIYYNAVQCASASNVSVTLDQVIPWMAAAAHCSVIDLLPRGEDTPEMHRAVKKFHRRIRPNEEDAEDKKSKMELHDNISKIRDLSIILAQLKYDTLTIEDRSLLLYAILRIQTDFVLASPDECLKRLFKHVMDENFGTPHNLAAFVSLFPLIIDDMMALFKLMQFVGECTIGVEPNWHRLALRIGMEIFIHCWNKPEYSSRLPDESTSYPTYVTQMIKLMGELLAESINDHPRDADAYQFYLTLMERYEMRFYRFLSPLRFFHRNT